MPGRDSTRARALLWALVPAVFGLGVIGAAGTSPVFAATLPGTTQQVSSTAHVPNPPAPVLHAHAVGPAGPTPGARALAVAAPAQTYLVNTPDDTTDVAPGTGGCKDAFGTCSLRAAIMEANADTGLTRINVPAGTYALTIPAVGSDDGSEGDLNLTNTSGGIQIVGAGAGSTTVDATGLGDRVFAIGTIQDEGTVPVPATISGLTISGGDTTTALDGNVGGGVANGTDGSLTLTNDVITGNTAESDGGGINNDGSLWLQHTTVSANTATGQDSGLGDGGGLNNAATATVNDSTFSTNHALGAGGGIYSLHPLVMTNSTVNDNMSEANAGGIDFEGQATLTSVTVTNNKAGSDGGGAYINYPLVWDGGTISHNSALGTSGFPTGNGGGIFVGALLSANLNKVTISSNQATSGTLGGGVYNGGALHLTDSSVTQNSGAEYGGGIYNNGVTHLTRTAVSSNSVTFGVDLPYGAGIYNGPTDGSSTDAELDLISAQASGNTGAYNGGGVFNAGHFTATGATLSGNSATASGAGLYTSESAPNSSQSSVNYSTIRNNSATGDGGGIWGGYSLSLRNSTVSSNDSGARGGGIYVDGTVTVDGGTISGNTAAVSGGGILNRGNLNLSKATVAGNGAPTGGGAANNSELNATATTFVGNMAQSGDGGAIANVKDGIEGVKTQLTNVTLTRNTATGNGGGIVSSERLTATEVTMNGNTAAGTGGGLSNSGFAQFRNSILAGNVNGSSANNCVNTASGGLSAGHNLDNGTSCHFSNVGDQSGANPHLAALGNNGGPTQTEALLAGSAALNRGGGVCPTSVDQRGLHRPRRGACDIGAFEKQ